MRVRDMTSIKNFKVKNIYIVSSYVNKSGIEQFMRIYCSKEIKTFRNYKMYLTNIKFQSGFLIKFGNGNQGVLYLSSLKYGCCIPYMRSLQANYFLNP